MTSVFNVAKLIPLFNYEVGGTLLFLLIVIVRYSLRTRRYYFVRHGQTLLNAAHIKQGAEGALSEKGHAQALQVAQRLTPLHIHRIFTSPFPRAQETAAILAKEMHAHVWITPLLVERRNPSAVIGKKTDDPNVRHATDVIDLTYHDDDFRYADEESFSDLKKRAKKCLRYLAHHGASRTCVVTHHAFLKMLLAYMLYSKDLHEPAFITLSFLNTADNGGVSIAEYTPWKHFSKTRGWSVVNYNEQIAQ